MSLTTVKITGTFNFPDASWTQYARAVFRLSGYDTDGEIVTPSTVTSDLTSSGELDVDLWPNTEGLRGTIYRVSVDIYTDNSFSNLVRSVDFGKIQVSEAADINTLLDTPVTVPGVWYSMLSEADYDAAIAARDDAEAARDKAQEWADKAEDSPVETDPDQFSAKHHALKSAGSASASAASAAEAALYDGPWLDDVAALLDDESLTYTAGQPGTVVEGDIVRTRAEGFSYEVAASGAADHHVTTAGGVKLYVLVGANGVVNVDALGAKGDGLTNDAGPVGVACANFLKVVCSPHRTYRFTEQVDVNDDLIFDFQGAQVIFGDGHLNLFNVLSAIDRLEIRNCGGVALEGVTLGDFAYKNFVSNRENTGTVIGFPTGTLFPVKTFLLENCSIDASRVFVQAEESFRALNNEFVSSDYKVRPGSLVGLGDEFSLVQGNRFEADYHEDVLKGGRGRARITKNHFIHTGSGKAEVDIYPTIDRCNIVDNYFFNAQIHRKQTGGSGPTVDQGFNVISGNNFEWTVSGYPIYFRGSEGVISNNVAKVTRTDTSSTAFIYVDAENENYDPSASTKGGFISVTGNLCDYRGGEQTNGSFCRVNPGSGSPESLAIIVSNNLCRGGDRFMRGGVEVLSGNAWVDGAGGGGADNHQIQIGNYMPSSSDIIGKMSEGYSFLRVDSGAEDQVIDTNNNLFIRKTGGGSIDNLTGAKQGTVVTIFNRADICTVKSSTSKIRLNGDVDFEMGTRHTLTLLKLADSDGGWQEISRTT